MTELEPTAEELEEGEQDEAVEVRCALDCSRNYFTQRAVHGYHMFDTRRRRHSTHGLHVFETRLGLHSTVDITAIRKNGMNRFCLRVFCFVFSYF